MAAPKPRQSRQNKSRSSTPPNNTNASRSKRRNPMFPSLPRIQRLSLKEEIRIAESYGKSGLCLQNIASIVRSSKSEKSNYFYDLIWEEDVNTVIDTSPPSHLEAASKRKITPIQRRRNASKSNDYKSSEFKSMNQLHTHRFHLAELFQNDIETQKDLKKCFEKVPSRFFEPNFECLPHPQNKKAATNGDSSDSDDMHEMKVQTKNNNILNLLRDCRNHKILKNQKKLTKYLDIVEVNLLKQICIQSESFFDGLKNIQLLQNDVCDILDNIQHLRTNLQRMEQYCIVRWATIINLYIEQMNHNSVLLVLEQIQNLQIMQRKLNELIAQNKYQSAVEILTECRKITNKYSHEIPVVYKFEKRLSKVQSTISIKLIYKIVDIAIVMSNEYIQNKSQKKRRKTSAIDHDLSQLIKIGDESKLEDDKHIEIENLIKSCILLQDPSKSTQTVYNTLQAKFNSKISEICNNNKRRGIENFVRCQNNNDYIETLCSVHVFGESILQSMSSICDLFESFLCQKNADFSDYGHINSSSIATYKSSSKTYKKQLCDEILALCCILLQARDGSNKANDMTLSQLKTIFAKTLSFLQNIESITHTTCYDIRGILLEQAQSFLRKFHTQRINKLSRNLEIDKWDSKPVAVVIQTMADQIQNAVIKPNTDSNKPNSNRALEKLTIKIDKKTLRNQYIESGMDVNDDDLMLEDEEDLTFRCVSSLSCLVELLYEYIEIAVKLPPIAYDVELKLVELFDLFNAKTCQLVLGAGAMQSVGLPSITAKHLALSQQCITVVLILLPVIHNKWFSKIIPKNCLPLIQSEIEKLNENLQSHSDKVFKKLISIMQGLIENAFKKYDKYLLGFDDKNGSESDNSHKMKIHSSVSSLMKDVRKMHRVLANYMQTYQIQIIFKPIVDKFETCLSILIEKLKKRKEINENTLTINDDGESNEKNEEKDICKKPNMSTSVNNRRMTEKFHSLNMTIRFISEKLNRLGCDAQRLSTLCIEID